MGNMQGINLNFSSMVEVITTFSNEKKCIEFLEKIIWKGQPISPFDKTSEVYKCKEDNKYICKNTRKYFNIKTNTMFENTKIPLQKWFMAIWFYSTHKSGLSSLQLSRDIRVTQKTAWFILQRIRNCSAFENKSGLDNEVEIDETYVGGKNKNRHANKKIQHSQGRSCKYKTPVLGMIEREGKVNAYVVPTTTSDDLIPKILRTVEILSTVYTDEWGAYNNLNKCFDHQFVKHGRGEYVRGKVHTNTIENFWGNFKRSIVGVYRVVSQKHLQLYVNEFVLRRNIMKMDSNERFIHLLSNISSSRLRYKDLIAA
jgi:transposase-like protein